MTETLLLPFRFPFMWDAFLMAAIIAVPTAVTGWFGQNVPYLGFGTRTGYALAAVLTVVPAAVVWWLMRRNDWI